MKKILFVLGILSLFLVAGCEKDNDTSNESILTGKQYYCNGSWRYYTLRLEFLSEKEARFYFSGTQNPKSTIVNYTYIKENETIIFNDASFHEPDDNIISYIYYIKSGEFFNKKQQFVIQYDWKYGDSLFQDYEFDFKLTE
jgi:hypothetical protein